MLNGAILTMERDLRPESPRSQDIRKRLQPILEQAAQRCAQEAKQFGMPFYHLAFRVIVSPGIPLQIFVDGGPKEEMRRAADVKFGPLTERILAKATMTTVPFEWSDAVEDNGNPPGGVERRNAARMRHGLAIPLHGPYGASGVWSLGGSTPLLGSRHMLDELMRHVQWTALDMFGQLVLKVVEELQRKPRERLTDRQYRALALAARGHSLAEIGREMKIHISTARYLIATAADKLGVNTREEAIVRFTLMDKSRSAMFPRTLRNSDVYLPMQIADHRDEDQMLRRAVAE